MHVLSDQSVHITHTYRCVSKLSKFGAYLYADNTVVYINNTLQSLSTVSASKIHDYIIVLLCVTVCPVMSFVYLIKYKNKGILCIAKKN
jgi:hypothetical protein